MSVLVFLILAADAHAYFDFVTEYDELHGEYTFSPSVVISEGGVRLGQKEGWALPSHRRRLEIHVLFDGTAPRPPYPVRVDLSAAPDSLFLHARPDGSDIVITKPDGSALTKVWLEHFAPLSQQGILWIATDLDPGDNLLYLYYDGPAHSGTSSRESAFSYPDPMEVMVPSDGTVQITSWWDVDVTLPDGSQVSVSPSSTYTGFVPAGTISCSGPCAVNEFNDGLDMGIPHSWAGTLFIYPAPRESDYFIVASVDGTAHVTLLDAGGAVLLDQDVGETPTRLVQDFDTMYTITSDRPVVVFHGTDSLYDGHPLAPASTRLVGGGRGTALLAAREDDTHVTVYYSNGSVLDRTLAAGEVLTLGSDLGYYVVASKPVGAISYADGDGGEAITFLPEEMLSTTYAVPFNSSYLVVVTLLPSTTCSVVEPDGTERTSFTDEGYAFPRPGYLIMTTGNPRKGDVLVCSAPVFAYAEQNTGKDEHNLVPLGTARPYYVPAEEVTIEGGDSPEYTHLFRQGWVETPDFIADSVVERWQEMVEYEPTEMPEHTSLGYQISLDGGETWKIFDGTTLVDVPDASATNTPWEMEHGIPFLPPTRRIRMRIFLEGDGLQTPVQGPIALFYVESEDQSPPVLLFDPIPSPQSQGIPFNVTIRAMDRFGVPLASEGTVFLSISDGRISPNTLEMVDGVAEGAVAVYDATGEVTLLAHLGSTTGSSSPIQIITETDMELEKVYGDGLYGTTDSTVLIVARLLSQGRPVPDYTVTFSVAGHTRFADTDETSQNVRTDSQGYASVVVVLAQGENIVHAGATGAAPVTFVLRGDKDRLVGAEAGCGCTVPGRSAPPVAPLALLPLALIAVMRGLARRWRR